jgi:hypothetical protein
MKCRKTLADMRLQAAQRVGSLFRIEKIRNGLEADRLAEPHCRALLVDGYTRHRGHLNLPRPVSDDVEQQHTRDNPDRCDHQ